MDASRTNLSPSPILKLQNVYFHLSRSRLDEVLTYRLEKSDKFTKKSANWIAHRQLLRGAFGVFRRNNDPEIFRILARNILSVDQHEHETVLDEAVEYFKE